MTKLETENFGYEVIKFLQGWDLWDGVAVVFNGNRYSGTEPEGVFGNLRDIRDIRISVSNDEEFKDYKNTVLVIECEGKLSEFLAYGSYCPKYDNLSYEAKLCVANEDGSVDYELEERLPILDRDDFDSYQEYLDLEAEMEEQEIHRILDDFYFGGQTCGEKVKNHIKNEFYALLEKYNVYDIADGIYFKIICREKE